MLLSRLENKAKVSRSRLSPGGEDSDQDLLFNKVNEVRAPRSLFVTSVGARSWGPYILLGKKTQPQIASWERRLSSAQLSSGFLSFSSIDIFS